MNQRIKHQASNNHNNNKYLIEKINLTLHRKNDRTRHCLHTSAELAILEITCLFDYTYRESYLFLLTIYQDISNTVLPQLQLNLIIKVSLHVRKDNFLTNLNYVPE